MIKFLISSKMEYFWNIQGHLCQGTPHVIEKSIIVKLKISPFCCSCSESIWIFHTYLASLDIAFLTKIIVIAGIWFCKCKLFKLKLFVIQCTRVMLAGIYYKSLCVFLLIMNLLSVYFSSFYVSIDLSRRFGIFFFLFSLIFI